MSQCLPCIHGDLSLIPRTYGNKPGVVVHACNPSPGNWRQAALWAVAYGIGGLPSLFGELQVEKKTLVSKNKVVGVRVRYHMVTHKSTQTPAHMQCTLKKRTSERNFSVSLCSSHVCGFICHLSMPASLCLGWHRVNVLCKLGPSILRYIMILSTN